jgi:hypothetical protein
MHSFCRARYFLAAALAVTAAFVAGAYFLFHPREVVESKSLQPFMHDRPPVPVVFTSRTEAASFEAAAPEADGFTYPGTVPWAAREGRLRLLDGDGKVYELTWGRTLPDGGTLIDIMSPSVSLDGKRVLFAGRKAPPDPGRWRIFQVDVTGKGLRQLTGGPDDPGCVAAPPLRFAPDGSRMREDERRKLDYDDVDPTDLGPNGFAFASSRIPDLGRDHTRRATQIWAWRPGEVAPTPLSANRNNDRWPVLVSGNFLVFSLWSRNREAVTGDRSEVLPVSEGGAYATAPTDRWMAARFRPNGALFGYAVKSQEPVWRPRPLFNGRLAFMTDFPGQAGRSRLAQADWGYIRSAPSSLPAGESMAYEGGAQLVFGPDRDADDRELAAGCPAPCPGGKVVFSGALQGTGPGGYGLYTVSEDWSGTPPVPQLLFDDPSFVDADPVAVYARGLIPEPTAEPLSEARAGYARPAALILADGRSYAGPSAYVENLAIPDAIRSPIPWRPTAGGERIDPRRNPLVAPPPNVDAVAFYAARRDRFDDPDVPRVPGTWEKLIVHHLNEGRALVGWVPSDPLAPTVLVGLDADGKVARWEGTVRDKSGRAATYFAYAGDHYSHTRANGYHYCNGCHTGHTYTSVNPTERLK